MKWDGLYVDRRSVVKYFDKGKQGCSEKIIFSNIFILNSIGGSKFSRSDCRNERQPSYHESSLLNKNQGCFEKINFSAFFKLNSIGGSKFSRSNCRNERQPSYHETSLLNKNQGN